MSIMFCTDCKKLYGPTGPCPICGKMGSRAVIKDKPWPAPVPNEPLDSQDPIKIAEIHGKRLVLSEPSAIGDELDALIDDVVPVHLQDKMKTLIEQQTKLAALEALKHWTTKYHDKPLEMYRMMRREIGEYDAQ